jgi:hypothetical protein
VIVGGKGFLDEIGLVIDAFYLVTDFDPDDVLGREPINGIPEARFF